MSDARENTAASSDEAVGEDVVPTAPARAENEAGPAAEPAPSGATAPAPASLRERPRAVDGAETDIPERLAYNVVLPEFEGPLDLLLFLCKTHEIDIVQLPVAFITSKYLEYLDLLQHGAVDVAAEYLVMAATLCYLKSRELVPAPEPVETQGEEDDLGMDPREELIRRLLEYQKYKDAAEQLGARPIEGRNVFNRGMPGYEGPRPEGGLAEHSPWKLIEAFSGILANAAPQHTHNVVVDRMSVAERINQLIDRLESGNGTFRFDSVIDLSLPEVELRHQLVVTLLAILELARLRAIRVLEDTSSHTFYITRSARVTDADLENAREAPVTSERGDGEEHGEAEANEATAEAAQAEAPAGEAQGALDGDDGELDLEGLDLGPDEEGDEAPESVFGAPGGTEDSIRASVDDVVDNEVIDETGVASAAVFAADATGELAGEPAAAGEEPSVEGGIDSDETQTATDEDFMSNQDAPESFTPAPDTDAGGVPEQELPEEPTEEHHGVVPDMIEDEPTKEVVTAVATDPELDVVEASGFDDELPTDISTPAHAPSAEPKDQDGQAQEEKEQE